MGISKNMEGAKLYNPWQKMKTPVLLAGLIALPLIYGLYLNRVYRPDPPRRLLFNKEVWKRADMVARCSMAEDLVASHTLLGLSSAQLFSLLGNGVVVTPRDRDIPSGTVYEYLMSSGYDRTAGGHRGVMPVYFKVLVVNDQVVRSWIVRGG